MTGSRITNAPGGALAAADVTTATNFPVSHLGAGKKLTLPSNVVSMIVNNALQSAGLAANAVTRAKLEKMAANGFMGNDNGATQDPQHLTVAEAQALLLGALTEADPVNGDFLVGIDTSDSNNIKKFDFKWMLREPDIVLQDQKSSGTNAGSSSAGANIRVLNTEVRDINGDCSLASNRFTLNPATYYIRASAPSFRSSSHGIYLYNYSDTANELVTGTHGYNNPSGDYSMNHAFLSGFFTLASAKALELRHYINSAKSTDGLGVGFSSGLTNVFAQVELWKVAA